PPFAGTFPDGSSFRPVPKVAKFFNEMKKRGFAYALSEEDTGPGPKLHDNGNKTEWWVAFYKAGAVTFLTNDLPRGFISSTHAHNSDFDRVPYAFPFRTADGKLDFVLISVHLHPDAGPANRARRKHELGAIRAWINTQTHPEKDFIILG